MWAWYVLPSQQWAFRSESQREALILSGGDALSALGGRRLHIRVTNRPYPVAGWARRLHGLTPSPMDAWPDHLVATQQHPRTQTMAEKEVYLGVRITDRSTTGLAIDEMLHRTTRREAAKLAPTVDRISEAVALPGLEGRPVTAAELEWLLRRSTALCLPPPLHLSPVRDDHWDTDDLHTLTDPVECEADTATRSPRPPADDPATGHPAEESDPAATARSAPRHISVIAPVRGIHGMLGHPTVKIRWIRPSRRRACYDCAKAGTATLQDRPSASTTTSAVTA